MKVKSNWDESGLWFAIDFKHRSYHLHFQWRHVCFGSYDLDVGDFIYQKSINF
jgi:DNA relaxase NicK